MANEFKVKNGLVVDTGGINTTGSVNISGSLTVGTSGITEFQVLPTGVVIGNIVTDIHSITGSVRISGSLNATASNAVSASYVLNAVSSSYAVSTLTASYALTSPYSGLQGTVPTWNQNTTGNANTATTAQTASFANNFTVAGTLTAQTINVQTITSSIEFNTGSTRNGSTTANTHEFTGSLFQTGSSVTFISNVGIGTSPSTARLSISGSNDASNTGVLELITPNTNLKMGGNSTYSWIQSHSSRPLYINELGNNVIINPGSGNLGVGTLSPSTKFHISGSTGGVLEVDGAATGQNALYVSASGNTGLGVLPSNTYRLEVNGTVGAVGYYETSDIRLKNVIETNPSIDLSSINVIKYNLYGSQDIHYGYSAQQVQSVCSDLVKSGEYLSLNYTDLHTLKILQLEQRIAQLEAQLSK